MAGLLLMLAIPAFAGKSYYVCRDIDGAPYFTDLGCPVEMEDHGRHYTPAAQAYGRHERIDTRVGSSWGSRSDIDQNWSRQTGARR